jgi:hypothetical protein
MIRHPYGGPAFLVVLFTAAVAFWLWPHKAWDEPAIPARVSHPTA